MRIERLKKEHGVEVKWVHFPLHPDTPAEGRSLEDLFRGRNYDIPKRQAEMRAGMAGEGLPFRDRKMTRKTTLRASRNTSLEKQRTSTIRHRNSVTQTTRTCSGSRKCT